WVSASLGYDEHGCVQKAELTVRGKNLRSVAQGTWFPPGVVIAECDQRGAYLVHSQVAARGAEVAASRDQCDLRVTLTHEACSIVGGTVVHHNHRQALMQLARVR